MKRRFTAEITFSGMVLVDIKDPPCPRSGERGPREADKVEVLLVRTTACHGESHRHHPKLVYFAEDDLSLPARSEVRPAPDGRETVSVNLTDKRVEIFAPWPYGNEPQEAGVRQQQQDAKHTFCWLEGQLARERTPSACRKEGEERKKEERKKDRSRGQRAPRPRLPLTPYEEHFLDWSILCEDFGLAGKDVRPDKAVTRVEVPPGSWRCTDVIRNREVASLAPVLWDVVGGDGEIKRSQAMARAVSLRLEGLRYGVSIVIHPLDDQGPSDEIVLIPGVDDRLKFAITNLPEVTPQVDESHLGMFAAIAAEGTMIDDARTAVADQVSCQSHTPRCDHATKT